MHHLDAAAVPLAPEWTVAALAGRLVELSGTHANASLTLAFALVLDAQRRGENAAWISALTPGFFPPDVDELGVDLSALALVQVPRLQEIAVATDWIVRSGAFGLVVLDLTPSERADLPLAAQSRLLSLAQKHATAIVCLTTKSKDQRSLSSLVSLRAQATFRRIAIDQFECRLEVLKDKQRSRVWTHTEVRHGTPGMR